MTNMEQEKKTVAKMIGLFCRQQHGAKGELCPECRELQEYAFLRLDKCKFGEAKPTCGKCPIHCYKPEMRQKITAIMRYSGPKMIWHHPVAAVRHLIHGMKK